MQVPAETMLTVLPETVHTPDVVDAKTTALPEAPPVAERPNVADGVNVCAATGVKLMV